MALAANGDAAIESEPAHPEHACAGHGQRQIMGWKGLGTEAAPRAQHHSGHQGRNPGGDVHHDATREIEQSQLGQPAAAPDPVRYGHIHRQQPEHAEPQHGGEFHALRKAADDERRGDNGKGHLKEREQGLGQCTAEGVRSHAGHQHAVEATDPSIERAAVAKGEAIAEEEPQ